MFRDVSKTVYLAGSTVELISALACISDSEAKNPTVFIEHNISFRPAAMKPLLAAARLRFPAVRFIDLEIERESSEYNGIGVRTFIKRWNSICSIRNQLDRTIQTHCGIGISEFSRGVREICFTTILHDYVPVFLAECRQAERTFFPHGFDHPRKQLVRDYGYEFMPSSLRTLIRTLPNQIKHFGIGGLTLGIVGRVVPGVTTTDLPFFGVDRVLTFRSDVDFVPNKTVRVRGLADTFQWLLGLEPWADALRQRRNQTATSALLLLPETNRHPIWEENKNYGLSHLRLLQAIAQQKGLKRFVIKAHVRSDGTAASWLTEYLRAQEPDWEVEVLPAVLHGLPVEALAMTGEFSAGCSLGSCSLPPGLGFGIPHYVSYEASGLFDKGWSYPFWLKYFDSARMLVREGICYEIKNQHT